MSRGLIIYVVVIVILSNNFFFYLCMIENKTCWIYAHKRQIAQKSKRYLRAAHNVLYLVKCFSRPCSDGLTMPLLAKRASSAGGKGILQHWKKGRWEIGATGSDRSRKIIFDLCSHWSWSKQNMWVKREHCVGAFCHDYNNGDLACDCGWLKGKYCRIRKKKPDSTMAYFQIVVSVWQWNVIFSPLACRISCVCVCA